MKNNLMHYKIKSKYFVSSVWYIIANSLGQGILLISSVLFSRIMPQLEYGLYSTYYSAVAILIPFVGANLFVGLNNGYIDFKEDREKFVSSIFFLSIIIFIIFTISSSFFRGLINNFFKVNISWLIYIIAIIHAYSFFIVSFYSSYANMENNYRIKSILLFFPNFLQVLFSFVLLLTLPKKMFLGRVLGSCFGVFSCAVIPLFVLLKKKEKLVNKEYYNYALKISVPSILSSLSYMILQHSDQVMITAFIGAEVTAVYSLVFLIGNALYGVLQATSGAFQSWLYRTLDRGNLESINIIQKWILLFFLTLSFVLLMISPEIIKVLSPRSFWDFRYIPPFVASTFIVVINSLYSLVGTFYKKTGILSFFVFIAAIINICLNYIFIRKNGAISAAYTSLISYFILAYLNYFLLVGMKKNFYSNKMFILFSVLLFAGCAIFLLVYPKIIFRYSVFSLLILLVFLYCFFHKDEISFIYKR